MGRVRRAVTRHCARSRKRDFVFGVAYSGNAVFIAKKNLQELQAIKNPLSGKTKRVLTSKPTGMKHSMNEAIRKDNIVQFRPPVVVDVEQEGQVVVDVDNGYTRIADELLEALCSVGWGGRHFRVFLSVLRKTYGFNKKSDWIALDQFVGMTGISKNHVSELLKDLVDAEILIRRGNSYAKEISINKAISAWGKPGQKANRIPKTGKKNKIPNSGKKVPESGNKLPESGNKLPEFGNHNRDKHKELKEKTGRVENEAAKRVIEYLNLKAGRKHKAVESSMKLIRARFSEGHTEDDCLMVIDAKCQSWLTNPKMFEYLRPATLFNAEKFNSYIGNIGATKPNMPGCVAVYDSSESAEEGFDLV